MGIFKLPPPRMIPNAISRARPTPGAQVSPAVASKPNLPTKKKESTRVVQPSDLAISPIKPGPHEGSIRPPQERPPQERPLQEPQEIDLLREEVRTLRAMLGELRARVIVLEIVTPIPSLAAHSGASLCTCETAVCTCGPAVIRTDPSRGPRF